MIPDVHTKPGISNERLEWAGSLAVDYMPEKIVCLGDWFSMDSLSSYDKNHKSFEGRRYKLDIDAGVDALKKFNKPIDELNEIFKKAKKSQYRPEKIMLLGNHENRLERCVNLHSELSGTLTNKDFKFEEHGWKVVPFLQPIEVEQIYFNHFFVSGVKGESISGASIASSMLAKNMCSCICGHNHQIDWAVRASPNGKKTMALCAGCYLAENQHEEYAHATEFLWWKGLCLLHDVNDGAYDLETFDIKRVRALYGKGN